MMTKYDVDASSTSSAGKGLRAIRKELLAIKPPLLSHHTSTSDKLFPTTITKQKSINMVAIIRSLRFAGKRVAATPLSAKPVQRSSFHFTALKAAGKESSLR